MPHWKPIAFAAASACAVAVLGVLSTDPSAWYAGLRKPAWQPPDFLSGPVWTLIYALTAIAGVSAWRSDIGGGARVDAGALRRQRVPQHLVEPALLPALLEAGVFWSSIVVLVIVTWRWSPRAAWLLVPYLLWVSLASMLNLAIVDRKAPFPAAWPNLLRGGIPWSRS